MKTGTPWQALKALGFDAMLWAYVVFGTYKVIYQQMIVQVRRPVFEAWELVFAAGGVVLAVLLYVAPGFSVGRRIQGTHAVGGKRPPYLFVAGLALLVTFVIGIELTDTSVREFLSADGMAGARRIFAALLTPNFSILPQTLLAAIETIYMAFIATAFALPVAFCLSFFAARNLMQGSPLTMAVYAAARFALNMTRSIEPLVWAIVFSVWVGIGPFAGTLALMLHSIASLAKLYSEQIENIDDGPVEAITATGAHPVQVVWFGVVPQVVLPFLSFTIYRWDINVRMATIIGLVGGGGIGTPLMQYQGLAKWNEVGMIVIVIAAIVWAMDYASARIRESLK